MNRFAQFLFICFLALPVLSSDTPANVTQLLDLLSNERTNDSFSIEATITDRQKHQSMFLVVQDGDSAALLWNYTDVNPSEIRPGRRIRATGSIDRRQKSDPTANCKTIEFLTDGELPPPKSASPSELSDGSLQHRLVRLTGRVIDIFPDDLDVNWTYLALDCQGTLAFVVNNSGPDCRLFDRFLGAEVSAVGTVQGNRSGARTQLKGVLHVHSDESISILKNPPIADPFEATDIGSFDFLSQKDRASFVKRRADGHVVAVWGGRHVLLRTDAGTLVRGELAEARPPAYGEHIRLVGFPETDLYTAILVRANWRSESTKIPFAEDAPRPITVDDLQPAKANGRQFDFRHNGHTVRLTGLIRNLPVQDGDGHLYLESDGRMVLVDTSSLPEVPNNVEAGCRVEVTGTCVMDTEKLGMSRAFPRITGYRIVPHAPSGIRVLSRPPWWTPGRLFAVIGALLLVIAGIVIWNVILRRLVERRSRALLNEQLARVESELKVGERTRLSVELHDTLSQNLVGAAMEINTVEQMIKGDEALNHLRIASKTIKSSRDELRNCLWDLRSQALEEPDMNAAIRKTLEPYVSDVDLQIRFNVPRKIFTDNTAHALMRIIRELVLNAIRHGHAKTVKIAGSREDGVLLFSVRDDGCGFDPATAPGIAQGHFGLQGVHERLRLLKGSVRIESSPGAGTYVSARFRLPDCEKEKI